MHSNLQTTTHKTLSPQGECEILLGCMLYTASFVYMRYFLNKLTADDVARL